MRTWIAIHLPLLPLEALRPRWSSPGRHVVIERERALVASELALADGVRAGMRKGGILSLCADAVLHARSEAAEQDALQQVAFGLLQYTPEVAHAEQHTLLLDVTASLRVFGGRRALCRLTLATVAALGFTPRLGMGPTGYGAWLLARHEAGPGRRRVVGLDMLRRRLDQLPYRLLPQAQPFADWLDGIGCRSLGDLRRLPRAGLKRRSSEGLLHALDCAYGEAPELFEWIRPPEHFQARIELPDRVEQAEALLFAARRLLLQMAGWLMARQLAARRFTLAMEHERGRQAVAPTLLEVVLAEPAWQEEHLTRVLKERLGRLQLRAPVIQLCLEATQLEPMAPPTETLFPEPGGQAEDFNRLLDLLVARLGANAVRMPTPRADHRPEVANRWEPLAPAGRNMPDWPKLERPFWLLEAPVQLMVRENRPFYNSPLQLLSPPERIECGWWDGQLVIRDYFIAQGQDLVNYWVYRERIGEDIRWYLHGLFG